MKLFVLVTVTAVGLAITGCEQPAATATTNSATIRSYKMTGNRSADLLGNYSPDNSGTGLSPDASSVAQHSGSSSFPSTNTVRGGR